MKTIYSISVVLVCFISITARAAAPDMVFVPAGYFPYQDGDPCYVASFWISKYETTNAQYCEFLNAADPNGQYWNSSQEIAWGGTSGSYSVYPGRENYPARAVSYYDANAYARWNGRRDGGEYRIPSEEEWEKAAGWDPNENHHYKSGFHSDTIDCTWCNYDAGGQGNSCYGGPLPVGSFNGTGGKKNAKS
jgi:formylglycine-generating enzyme required for sulfatase activity